MRTFPKSRLFWLWISLVAIESLLLLAGRRTPYAEGPLIGTFAVGFLALSWASTLLIGRKLIRGTQAIDNRALRYISAAGLGAVGVLLGLQHTFSWAMYLKAGAFANIASLTFAYQNPPRTTWLYLGPGERTALIVSAIVCAIAWPTIAYFISRFRRTTEANRPMMIRCLCLALVVAGMFLTVQKDPSITRRGVRMSAIANCVSPELSLGASIARSILAEPIAPVLNTNELEPIREWTAPTPEKPRPSIILLAIEALRSDVVGLRHQGREVTPNLNRLARNGLVWDNAYSQSTHSDYSDVCLVSSLFPLRTTSHHYYHREDPWPKALAFDVFKQAGYETAIISSQNEAWGCMDQFLETESLDLFYDAKRSGAETYVVSVEDQFTIENKLGTFSAGCLYDPHTAQTAVRWMDQCFDNSKPFFLSMNFQASHFPYELPEGSEQPFQPCELTNDISFLDYPTEKTHIVRNAYYNGLHHCDVQLGKMIDSLERAGKLDEVVFVVVGENGEAFHENGCVGHAAHPMEPTVHVAAVMHGPKYFKPGHESYPMELVDLLPTILGRLDWPEHPNFQGIDALAESRPTVDDRSLFFHVNSPAANADALLHSGRWKYMIDHDSGLEFLFDLRSDPTESNNLLGSKPAQAELLRDLLLTWRSRQLAYYHFANYYENFYPPKSPRLERGSMLTSY